MQAYCMKCRGKREMKNAKSITMRNGSPATQGICSVCGTKVFRIGKSKSQYRGYQDYQRGWVSVYRCPCFLLSIIYSAISSHVYSVSPHYSIVTATGQLFKQLSNHTRCTLLAIVESSFHIDLPALFGFQQLIFILAKHRYQSSSSGLKRQIFSQYLTIFSR